MEDIWAEGELNTEKVINTFLVYLGVMFGVSGASATLKAMSSALAKQALEKLPQKALTKTFYYPMIKSIARFFGKEMTKEVFAKGVSKAIPFVGGFASGGLTLATMRPMGMRLVGCLDEARFDYTEEDLENDLEEIQQVITAEIEQEPVVEYVVENAPNLEAEITKAKSLLDEGLITPEEYSEIKARLISKL